MAILSTAIDLYAGGAGSGCNPSAGVCGRKPKGKSAERVARALKAYKPFTLDKMQKAMETERLVAQALGGIHIGEDLGQAGKYKVTSKYSSRSPFDVVVPSKKLAVEVKTIIDPNAKPKITDKKDTRERKEQYVKLNRIQKTYTVVRDMRSKPAVWYYREGTGSFWLHRMNPVKSQADLKGVIK